MAIIYSYPDKSTIVANDTFVINDSEDNNKTKNVTAGSILSYIDGNMSYDLQQVLNSGSTATANNQPWAGALRLTGISGAPQTAISLDTTSTAGSGSASIFANNGDLELQGLTSGGNVIARAAQLSGSLTANTGVFNSTLNVSGVLTANSNINANGNLITNNSGILAVRSQGGLSLDANNGNNPTIDLSASGGVSIISEGSGNIVISPEFAGTGNITLGNNTTGVVESISERFDASAANGVSLSNSTTGLLTIEQQGNDNLNILKQNAGDLNIISDNDINLDAVDKVTIAGPTVGKYLKVSKGSAGLPIPLGTAVYISGWSSGVTLVEACNPSDLSTMPSIGVVTDDVAFGQGATGEIIISGSHEFASGTIVPSGNANDPLYVGTTGAITATRPVANNIRQKIGRILNNSGTADEIYVNCVGILENESGTLSATIYQGSTPVTFNPAATSSGRWIYDGEIMSGFAKITVPPQLSPQSFTNSFGVKFEITSGGSGNLLNTYQVNSNLPGKIDIVEAINWDPPSSPYSGIIANTGPTAVATFQRPNTPDDYNLVNIPSWSINTLDKILTLRFSYRVN